MKKISLQPALIVLMLLFSATATAYAASNVSDLYLSNKGPGKLESLSGINLVPVKQNGTFEIQFTNEVNENSMLEVTNSAGQLVFTKQLAGLDNPENKKVNVGNLKSGVYLIEVKSGNTIYWKKFKIRR